MKKELQLLNAAFAAERVAEVLEKFPAAARAAAAQGDTKISIVQGGHCVYCTTADEKGKVKHHFAIDGRLNLEEVAADLAESFGLDISKTVSLFGEKVAVELTWA